MAQGMYQTKSVKYLGIKIDENLTWIDHINDIAVRLNRAIATLSRAREIVNTIILKSIYCAIFLFSLKLCKHSLGSKQKFN